LDEALPFRGLACESDLGDHPAKQAPRRRPSCARHPLKLADVPDVVEQQPDEIGGTG
jgi:hypothetical protein